MIAPVGFTGSPLERLDTERHDPARVAELAANPSAQLLALDDYVPQTEDHRLTWQPMRPLPADELLLLGLIDGRPRFVHICPDADPAVRTPALMDLLDALKPGEAGTYAAARAVLDWHARHRFCARCGTRSLVHHAGWARLCPACGTEHYPRTDPVVIMLAEHDGCILVGRQPSFAPGRYSALAGFIEAGESIEEAVARELHEEAGVIATGVRYVASQPWPFPSQLMIACIAEVRDQTIRLDDAELEDAMWVNPQQVAAALAGDPAAPFTAPPRYAIANTLFQAWLEEG